MSGVNEMFELKGRVRVELWDAVKYPTYSRVLEARRSGVKPLEEHATENLIVTAGKNFIASLLTGACSSSLQWCGVGSCSTAAAVGDGDVKSPVDGRKLYSDRFRTNNVASFSFFFTSTDNNGVWRECVLAVLQYAGAILARAIFSTEIVKDSTKTVTVEWDVQCG